MAYLPECARSKRIRLLENTPTRLGPSGPSGPVHGGAGPDGPKSEENSFLNKNYIFEYTNALEICTRRFWRNLDMRIFPKFF
jgi:hypothetical protein